MSFLTQPSKGTGDIGEILVKVQDDLRHLKDQIITTAGGKSVEYIDIQAIEDAINRTEKSIWDKAEQVIQSANNKVLVLPSLDEATSAALSVKPVDSFGSDKEKQIVAFKNVRPVQELSYSGLLQPLVVAREGNKPGPNAPSPGQHSRELRNLKALTNPSNTAARELLNDRYGITLPNIKDKKEPSDKFPGRIVTGPTVEALTTLPKANRVDPSRTPPPISEEDANKGILSLIERGLIPPAAELCLEPSPVSHRQATLHDAMEQFGKQRAPPPSNVQGVGGYNLAAVKMDPESVQISKETALAHRQRLKSPTNLKHVASQQLQGWTSSHKRKQLPLKADEEPDQIVGPVPTPLIEVKSSHTFVIQNGKTRVTSQDYLDFKQHYCLSWGSILTLILKLEELMTNYSVPIAFIDADRLADLSLLFELEHLPTIEHFMTCILNAQDVMKIIKTPGRRYLGPDGQEMAVLKIQATWRMYKDRLAYLHHRKQTRAAGVIAISWIMNCKLSMVRRELRLKRQRELDRFRIRAGELKNNWPRIKNSRRVIIHIPSLGYSQHIRENLDEINILQNLQMARLCDIVDPGVEVIYICPVEINDEVYQYYSKLLAMKARPASGLSEGEGNGDEVDIENRYKIIVPDAVRRFPSHNMCLATLLKYSPKTVNRIKNLIKGRDAYIVPGVLHKDDVSVADLLDVPILSAEPEVASLYSTKSGSKRIFIAARTDTPPGSYDIYSLAQLYESLSQLVTENLHITRWLFKMDNEFDGRGTAYCDITPHLKCHAWAMKECQRYGEKWIKSWAHEPTLIKVSAEIPDILQNYAITVNQKMYPTWDKYLADFLKRGGVIEANPPSDSVISLSVDVLVEPSGEVNILSMTDQIHATSPFRCWGYSFPQSSVDPLQLSTAAEAISVCCRQRGIMGYFSIDFVTFIDPKTMKQVLWAVDLKLNYSDSLAMSRLMDYVSGGSFNPQLSSYEVPVRKKREQSGRRRRRRTISKDDEKEVEAPANPNRWAILSSRLLHSNLSVIHYSVFFQMCRAHGIGFDMKEKAGTIFTLVDSSKRDHLGMFVMSDDLQGSLSTFARNLSVIHQEISAPNMQGESNFQAVIDDIDAILGTTEANKNRPPPSRSPQLQAPRPREMQRILQEHQQAIQSTADKDRKEMEKHRQQQLSAVTADQKSSDKLRSENHGRVETGINSAPPPSPAASVVGLDPATPHPPQENSSELARDAHNEKQRLAPTPPPEPKQPPHPESSSARTEVGQEDTVNQAGNFSNK